MYQATDDPAQQALIETALATLANDLDTDIKNLEVWTKEIKEDG